MERTREYWESAVELTRTLCSMNSYEMQGKEDCVAYVEALLREKTNAEVSVHRVPTGEPFLIAKILPEHAEYRLLLDGHLDVVSGEGMEDPFHPVIRDGVMYGRGVADMKGGCSAMITAFIAAAQDETLKAELYLLLSTDEEYAGEEIKLALREGLIPKVDFAMIAEPTGGCLRPAHKGEAWADVEFWGKSAHSSTPHLGINALYMATAYVEKLRARLPQYDAQEHPLYGKPTMNVGVMEAGSTPNVVPPYAKLMIDIRYLPGQEYQTFENDLNEVLEELKREWPEVRGKITITGNWNSLLTAPEDPNLQRVHAVLERTLNRPVETAMMTAWGEGGYINMYGIPAAYFGPGDMACAHTPGEYVEIREISEDAEAYYRIIQEFCC